MVISSFIKYYWSKLNKESHIQFIGAYYRFKKSLFWYTVMQMFRVNIREAAFDEV